jgi:hypothetical protein
MRKLANAPSLNMPHPTRPNQPSPRSYATSQLSSADLTDQDGRVWNYLGRAGSAKTQFEEAKPGTTNGTSPVAEALRLRPRLLLNGNVYRLSAADVIVIAESRTSH